MQQIIREAIVIDVDVKKQTCKLDYGDARLSEMSSDIPLPNMIGSGNNGLINIIKPNKNKTLIYVCRKRLGLVYDNLKCKYYQTEDFSKRNITSILNEAIINQK